MARAVRPVARNEDVLARYGGAEFAAIVRGLSINGCFGCAALQGRYDMKPIRHETQSLTGIVREDFYVANHGDAAC